MDWLYLGGVLALATLTAMAAAALQRSAVGEGER